MRLWQSRKKNKPLPRVQLGRGRNGQPIYMRQPVFKGQQGSDTVIVCGMTGSGKSVITRVLADKHSRSRPVIIFDWAGRDHYLGHYPNRHPVNLPVGLHPRPLRGKYFFYPTIDARPPMRYEIIVRPTFTKYNYEQFESMGLSGAAPKNLRNIIEKYGPFKNIESLCDFIERFPTSERQSAARSKSVPFGALHPRLYRAGDIIRADSLNAITRDLRLNVQGKNVWCMKHKDVMARWSGEKWGFAGYVDVDELVQSGENLVFSYNDLPLARAEIDYFIKRLQRIIDKNPGLPRPFIFVEEAHKIFGANKDGLADAIENFVLVCRKLGIGLCMTMPTLEPLNSTVASDVKNWIMGKLKGQSAWLAVKYIGDEARICPYLTMNRYTGIREFMYYSQDEDRGFIFQAFECPQEYNRRV